MRRELSQGREALPLSRWEFEGEGGEAAGVALAGDGAAEGLGAAGGLDMRGLPSSFARRLRARYKREESSVTGGEIATSLASQHPSRSTSQSFKAIVWLQAEPFAA